MTRKVLFVMAILMFMSAKVFCQVRSGSMTTGDDNSNDDNLIGSEHFKPKFVLGVGIGMSNIFGDFSSSVPMPAGRIGLGAKVTTKLVAGVEGFFGQFSSKQPQNKWTPGMTSTGYFYAMDVNAKVTLGNYLEYPNNIFMKILSGFYVGSGIGMVHSNMTVTGNFYSTKDYAKIYKNMKNGEYTKNSESTPYIPINVGLRVHLKEFLGTKNSQFMLNYQINYSFSDYLDGYKFSTSTALNGFNDCYTIITMGFSFNLSKD